MKLPEDIREVLDKSTLLYTKQEIEQALDKMAMSISARVADKNPIFLCVVIGGIIPMGNLLPRLDFPLEVDYIHATRYRGNTKGGEIHWKVEPSSDFKDRTVVVVDDILDEGETLTAVVKYCKDKGAKDVLTAILVDKKKPRAENAIQQADFDGLIVEDRFVFGYGMDYAEYLRNAPGIYAVAPEHE